MLYIDLDNFKAVNDSLGHDAGDLLLTTIAKRLVNTCREIDFIARLGGDEFCILIEEIDDREIEDDEEVRQAHEGPGLPLGHPRSIAQVGGGGFPAHAQRAQQTVDRQALAEIGRASCRERVYVLV